MSGAAEWEMEYPVSAGLIKRRNKKKKKKKKKKQKKLFLP
jgi:hypothetical protein